jgi:hypothetical protein
MERKSPPSHVPHPARRSRTRPIRKAHNKLRIASLNFAVLGRPFALPVCSGLKRVALLVIAYLSQLTRYLAS